MKYKDKNVFSSGDIADKLGFNDYHRVSNYLGKINVKYVTRRGNTRYYDEKTSNKVITYFKSLNSNHSSISKKDKVIEDLRNELREQKRTSDKKFLEQQKSYERLLSEKDKRIDDLRNSHDVDLKTQKEAYEKLLTEKDNHMADLQTQVNTQNKQIESWNLATNRAQSLDWANKKPKQLDENADTSNENQISLKKAKNQSSDTKLKKHWWRFWR